MLRLTHTPVCFRGGAFVPADDAARADGTMAYRILSAHNASGDMRALRLRFDALASHDITYVGIIQTARAAGLESFPVPYVLTNCHNSLCAVGGTINEDDHAFGLSAAVRYGGEYVPAHQAVIHAYMRERYAKPGALILGSDSHTRYGPFGTLAIGEGGPELARQLLGKTYDIAYPAVIAVELTGCPRRGVGPQDVALTLIAAVFRNRFVSNAVLEFVGDGIANLSMDYRAAIDVMTTETTCLSSLWQTDETVRAALTALGRGGDFASLRPAEGARYDGHISIDLSAVVPMIALPFHPSNAFPIRDFKANLHDMLREVDRTAADQLALAAPPPSLLEKIRDGQMFVDQGVIAGCAGGTWQSLRRAAQILDGQSVGSGAFSLSCYPASQPMMLALTADGSIASLMAAGASVRSCFCGPCFGAGDVPASGGFSIRHTTRNFPSREGAKPGEGQLAYVALMDARSIAATALHGGRLTAADELPAPPVDSPDENWHYDDAPYRARVYRGVGKPDKAHALVLGPNIADWPAQIPLPQHLELTFAAAIYDPVTTTDELIPSGEASSYRSNPLRLAEFTLSRRAPDYVRRAKEIQAKERARQQHGGGDTGFGSILLALRPGDGSAREQAASCQRVLGGCANLAEGYATKRYRSNVVNWGMLPLVADDLRQYNIAPGDVLVLRDIRALLTGDGEQLTAILRQTGGETPIPVRLPDLTREERDVILAGCLINYYAQ